MSNKKKFRVNFRNIMGAFFALILNFNDNNAQAVQIELHPTEDTLSFQDDDINIQDFENNLEAINMPNKWEQLANKAALSWGMDYKKFRSEAEEFLLAYKVTHPFSFYPSSVEDLIILNKPDINVIREKLTEFSKIYPEKDINALAEQVSKNISQTPKFLVPTS